MSIKSTQDITRQEAIDMIAYLYGVFEENRENIYKNIDDSEYRFEWIVSCLEDALYIHSEVEDSYDGIEPDEYSLVAEMSNDKLSSIAQCMDDLTSFGYESFNNYYITDGE